MTPSSPPLEKSPKSDGPAPAEPYRNPSYPKRNHYGERARLEQVLETCKERIATAHGRVKASAIQTENPALVRTYHQLLGIRDQLADCVCRMPLETGSLYTEDNERFVQAAQALDRVWRRWQALGG